MNEDVTLLCDAALEAGALALKMRQNGIKIWSKSGGSPVTDADLAVDKLLRERLCAARPDHGWLSEETADTTDRLSNSRLFVVDPIDGTAAYMKSKPWWTVALAIVEDCRPTAAVIHAPMLNETFAAALGEGATLNGEPIRATDATSLDDADVLADAKLFEQSLWPEPWPSMNFGRRNSIAYRMALVAAGAFDACIAISPKWDWDVCAGALICAEAGGVTSDHLGRPYLFNKPKPQQTSLVCAAPGLHPLILRRCALISAPD